MPNFNFKSHKIKIDIILIIHMAKTPRIATWLQTDERTNERTDERTDERTNGRTDERTNGRTE